MTDHDEQTYRESYLQPNTLPLKLKRTGSFIRLSTFVVFALALFLTVFYTLFMMPLPYYIFRPGTAEEIRPMVQVKQGGYPEKGTFMLTTVRVSDASVVGYLLAINGLRGDLYKKDSIMLDGETEEQYNERQDYIMQTSQSSALQVAYLKANIPYRIQNDGVIVIRTFPGLPAAEVLQAGDHLLKVDEIPIHVSKDLQDYIITKKQGDTVKLTIKRGKASPIVESITLANMPPGSPAPIVYEPPKPGLGIRHLGDLQSIRSVQEKQQVTIKAGDIGGPSAGLMFSLEIYNQLVQGDITRGYRIAGTGTINDKGMIGPIGGIQYKIVAAEREGADIFFAPIENIIVAENQAKKIKSKMKIIAVETFDDALNYLANYPIKSS